jgi:hypothetical protein
MLRHMRTSIEISDALLERVRRVARRRGTTLRALVEEGLRRVLAERESEPAFCLEDGSFGEGGLVDGLAEGDWERIRELTYEGRGT